jgi:DNA-directed RNA polymerase sigma subunit (sigma70/sigma32)
MTSAAELAKTATTGEPLDRIRAAVQLAALADQLTSDAVLHARTHNVDLPRWHIERRHRTTWEQVAQALGVSRQAAWERYRHLEETPPPAPEPKRPTPRGPGWEGSAWTSL